MIVNVTQLFTQCKDRRTVTATAERERYMPEFTHALALPLSTNVAPSLEDYLERIGLGRDARNLWVGYPNLQQSVTKLMHWIGPLWPSQHDGEIPAVFYAVEQAVVAVRAGIERDESDRRFVVANFHNGLAKLADELQSFAVWGCAGAKAVAQFVPFEERLDVWSEGGQFDRIIFSPKRGTQTSEHIGLVWKMRACICPNRDIGVIHKYGER